MIGMMVRVIRLVSALIENGTTGWAVKVSRVASLLPMPVSQLVLDRHAHQVGNGVGQFLGQFCSTVLCRGCGVLGANRASHNAQANTQQHQPGA